jgi:hypothetical protein
MSYATGPHGRTRDFSPRQLPTNHDHDGESCTRSTNIRVINRRLLLSRPLSPGAWPRQHQDDFVLTHQMLTGCSISGHHYVTKRSESAFL